MGYSNVVVNRKTWTPVQRGHGVGHRQLRAFFEMVPARRGKRKCSSVVPSQLSNDDLVLQKVTPKRVG